MIQGNAMDAIESIFDADTNAYIEANNIIEIVRHISVLDNPRRQIACNAISAMLFSMRLQGDITDAERQECNAVVLALQGFSVVR